MAVLLAPYVWTELGLSWHATAVELASSGYRVIVPDMRGYGFTEAPESVAAYSMKHITQDMVCLLDHLHIRRAGMPSISSFVCMFFLMCDCGGCVDCGGRVDWWPCGVVQRLLAHCFRCCPHLISVTVWLPPPQSSLATTGVVPWCGHSLNITPCVFMR